MRTYAKAFPIDRLSLEARVLYTAFCVFLGLGGASALWLYGAAGHSVDGAGTRAYYLGETPEVRGVSARDANAADTPPPGPAMPAGLDDALGALEDSAPASPEPDTLGMPARQVIETFHFHLFSVPLCLLVVGHIFMMVPWRPRTKAWWLAITSGATLAHLVTPLGVRFVSPHLSVLMGATALLAAVMWMVLTVVPVVYMWRATRPVRPRG